MIDVPLTISQAITAINNIFDDAKRNAAAVLTAALKAVGTPVVGAPPAGVVVPERYHYMPATGHVLPPVEAVDTSIWGYMIRAAGALGPGYNQSTRLAGIASAWAGEKPNGPQYRDLWPEAADRACNPEAYMTPAELAAYKAAEQAGKVGDFVSSRPPAAKPQPPALPPVGSE